MRRAVIVLAVLLALFGGTACSGDSGTVRSSRTQCTAGVCQIKLSGEQTIDVSIGSFERDLRIGPIEPDAVTLSVRGDQARLAPGESARLGDLQITVKSVSGRDAQLEVRRA